ncbi:hypothetical protein DPMN_158810 [Dreissena polymorpha]|uniref:Uncharacterized protein n=1 Tax=Dreissena polymorpha TaxID=45954 RepID=A0A9D4EM29_DREPO|nr:hypothetical protein DPMN_158810 [Dreissena polymorpha]
MTENGTSGIGGVVAENVKTLGVTLGRSTLVGRKLGTIYKAPSLSCLFSNMEYITEIVVETTGIGSETEPSARPEYPIELGRKVKHIPSQRRRLENQRSPVEDQY